MKGGYLHNHTLLDPIISSFRNIGANIRREYASSRQSGYVDCLVEHEGCRIAVEAELSSRRICNDIGKAAVLSADWLLIVTPTGRIARACRAALVGCVVPSSLTICFLTLGTFPQWFAHYCALLSAAKVGSTFSPENQPLIS